MDRKFSNKIDFSRFITENSYNDESSTLPPIRTRNIKGNNKNLIVNTMEKLSSTLNNSKQNSPQRTGVFQNYMNLYKQNSRKETEVVKNFETEVSERGKKYQQIALSQMDLDKNKNIQDEVMAIFTQRQINSYIEKIDNSKISNKKIKVKILKKPEEPVFKSNKNLTILKELKSSYREIIIKCYEVKGNYFSPIFKPSTREGADIIEYNNNLYLISGLSTERKFDIYCCNLKYLKWNDVLYEGDQPLPRLGQTSVLYKNLIITYGGSVKDICRIPEDLIVYDTGYNCIIFPECKGVKKKVRPRRNHIAVVVGQYMFIHGGIDMSGEMLDDCFLLELNLFRWKAFEDDYKINGKIGHLAYHSAVPLLHLDRRHTEGVFFKNIEIGIHSKNKVILYNIV
jgi:hypothetical protein